jgi:hypothetical protein
MCTTLLLLAGCVGAIGDSELAAKPLTVQLIDSELGLESLGGFADEHGGGIFVTQEGTVARLRSDGSRAPLESHPGNSAAPGKVLRVLPSGPHSALVAAENGVYLAESGWLIEPAWREALEPEGLVAAALGSDGIAWIAHQRGLFRLEAGELSELKQQGSSLRGITALAVAPAPDGAPAVWFAQADRLSLAKQTSRTRFEVLENGPGADELDGKILALAGISAAQDAPAELWLISETGLFRHGASGWVRTVTQYKPKQLISGGRWLWLSAAGHVYRYDANLRQWGEVMNLSAPELIAGDAAGSLWLRSGERSLELNTGTVPRLVGLFEGARVYTRDLRVRAQLPVDAAPLAVEFALDDGERIERSADEALTPEGSTQPTLEFALGGFDAALREQGFSLAGLKSGLHTLRVTARFATGTSERALTFELRDSAATKLSFASDVAPIYETRCAKCHEKGPGHALGGYEQWSVEKERIVSAVVELRMPADGPLDPAQIQIIQRWAAGGAAP